MGPDTEGLGSTDAHGRGDNRQSDACHRIAELFEAIPDDLVFPMVLRAVLKATESKAGLLGYISADGDWVCPAIVQDTDKVQGPVSWPTRFPKEAWTGIWGTALREGVSRSSDVPVELLGGRFVLSKAVAVPIKHGGKVIGALLVGGRETTYGGEETADMMAMAETMAMHLDARLHGGRTGGEGTRATSGPDLDLRLLDVLTTSVDFFLTHEGDAAYAAVAQSISESVEDSRAFIGHITGGTRLVCPMQSWSGDPVEVPRQGGVVLELGEFDGILDRALATRAVQRSDVPSGNPAVGRIDHHVELTPIIHRGDVVGGILVLHGRDGGEGSGAPLVGSLARVLAPLIAWRASGPVEGPGPQHTSGTVDQSVADFPEECADSSDLVASLDGSGRFVSFNDSFLTALDLTDEDTKGLTIWNLLPPGHWRDFMRLLRDSMSGVPVNALCLTLRSRKGRTVDVEGSMAMRRAHAGPSHIICILRDVTDRRLEERNIKEQRNRARFYLDLLTHDVNNLNQGVVMCMELILAKDDIPEAARSYLERTYDQTLEVSRLIRAVGRLSEMRDGGPTMSLVDGRQVVEAAAVRAQLLRKGRRIDVRLTAPTGALPIRGNQLLEEAFGHLFDYIAKMDRSAPVQIDVTFHLAEGGRRWRVVVEGRGVEFVKPFSSDDLMWPERRDGSVSLADLGLTIVIEVVTQLGGRIQTEKVQTGGAKALSSAIVLFLERGTGDDVVAEEPLDGAARMAIPW